LSILAISDIHGCLNTFKAILQKIDYTKKDQLFLVGDFIDRGPNSKGVIDHIWHLQNQGYTITCLKGNHEQMLLNSLTDWETARNWLYHGGSQTLDSFEASDLQHAGLNFDVLNPYEAEHSMLWIRDWYANVNFDWLGNRIIVHGHTPFKKSSIEEMFTKMDYLQVLDIDAGCCFDYEGLGHLCAVDLSNRALHFRKRIL